MNLDSKTLYYMTCRDVLKDFAVSADEEKVLAGLRQILELSDEAAAAIQAKAGEGSGDAPQEPLDRISLFEACCRVAWADAVMELSEATHLTDLSEVLQIPYEEASTIFAQVKEELGA